MRVRIFELRLIAVALTACWTVAAGLVLLAFRPGGPFDVIVGLLALIPIGIAATGVVWPPLARGDRVYPATVWLGIVAMLFLVPSITGVVTQLQTFGSRTLLPSLEAAYPWVIALFATSLYSGFGVARRWHGGLAVRRRRLLAGTGFAIVATLVSAVGFGVAAVANDVALRDQPVLSSRFGPTSGPEQPPLCDAALAVGDSARLDLHMDATIDLRPVGSVEVRGTRVKRDFRWLAYVASSRQLGQFGAASMSGRAWTVSPGDRWKSVEPEAVARDTLDLQAFEVALTPDIRATAEDRGVEVIEGARARRCKVSIDGAIFSSAFPQATLLVGDADLDKWRGQLDYWVFLDSQLGQIAGTVNGEATEIAPNALNGTIEIRLSATERGRDLFIYPPRQ